MPDFVTTLRGLLEKDEPYRVAVFLKIRAEAILRVVEAAKERHSMEGAKRLREALAALNKDA